MAKKINVKLVKSTIGQKQPVCKTVRSLGLKKINSAVEHDATPAILGMVKAVEHLVEIKELD